MTTLIDDLHAFFDRYQCTTDKSGYVRSPYWVDERPMQGAVVELLAMAMHERLGQRAVSADLSARSKRNEASRESAIREAAVVVLGVIAWVVRGPADD